MSKAKFTPGPWTTDQPAMGFSSLRAGNKLVFALACPSKAHGDAELSEEEKWANLALLEHAPDLYDALESADVHLEEMRKDPKHHPIAHCPVLDMVRAALAKARGEA